MNGRTGTALEDTNPAYTADRVRTEEIPTCARGLAVAALTIVVVATGVLAAISAFRSPLDHARSAVTLATVPAPHVVPADAPAQHADDVGELDAPRDAVEPNVVVSAPAHVAPVRPDSTTGALVLPPAAYGHRVFVEDRVVASAAAEVSVACGRHRIKIGSRGRDRQIVVPCGGDVLVTYP